MKPEGSKFGPARLLAAIMAGIFLLLVVVRAPVLLRTVVLEQGDLAANALQIYHAKHFAEIYGNYSRFEFNHPGPAFFYVYAAGEWLFHDLLRLTASPAGSHLLAAALLQAGFFAGALVLLAPRVGRRSFVPLALLAGAVYFGKWREPLTSIWAPHALPLPFLYFLAAATSVALGAVRHVVWLVLAGGFLVHGHVAQPLFVGAIGTLALVLGFRATRTGVVPERAGSNPRRVWLVGASVLMLLFVLPLAIDLATRGARGNVATILGRFGANASDRLSLLQSLLFFVAYPVSGREHNALFDTISPATWAFLGDKAAAIGAWIGVLLVPSWVAWRRRAQLRDGERRFFRAAAAVLALAVACALIWGMAQAGGAKNFNGFVFHGLFFFAVLLGLALASRAVEARWMPSATWGVALLATGVASYGLRARPISEDERGVAIQRGVARLLAAENDPRPKLLLLAADNWDIGAAVALELTRRGAKFYVPPWWTYVFQPRADRTRAGLAGETARLDVWWIGAAAEFGVPLARGWAVFRTPAPLDPSGGAMRFERRGNGLRYVAAGLSDAPEPDCAVSNERAAELRFSPGPAPRAVRLIFDVQSAREAGDEAAAEVVFNAAALGRVVAYGARAELSIPVPAEVWNRFPAGTLELRFPDAAPRRGRARPDYEAWPAWRLWGVRCECP